MSTRNEQIRENVAIVKERIATAAKRSGRTASDVTLLAVTKRVSLEDIRSAAEAGVKVIGENKIQEAKTKFLHLGPSLSWHMLGHLQTNKVRPAVAMFNMVESLDSVRLADSLDREAALFERTLDVLIEVNIGGEAQKFGVVPENALTFLRYVESKENLRLNGFMAMAPYVDDVELVRPLFRKLKQLFDEARQSVKNPEHWSVLSMGMTQDFEVAVEEGATLVRIGTGLFATPSPLRRVE